MELWIIIAGKLQSGPRLQLLQQVRFHAGVFTKDIPVLSRVGREVIEIPPSPAQSCPEQGQDADEHGEIYNFRTKHGDTHQQRQRGIMQDATLRLEIEDKME